MKEGYAFAYLGMDRKIRLKRIFNNVEKSVMD
jgi:hypothetical protein